MKKCNEVISLGYNCEISFRIRDYYGELCSWPFSWSYILDRDTFLEALDNMEEIFQENVKVCLDPRVNSMIECEKYHICFHPRGSYVAQDGSIPDETFDEAVAELRQRVLHLVKKFKSSLLDRTKNYIFFIGLTDNGKTDDKEFIINLENKLDVLCPNKNYKLVVVVPDNRYKKELEELNSESIKIRRIKKFGKQKCNDISTDAIGWGKIFKEFLGAEGIHMYYQRLEKHRIERVIGAIKKRMQQLI